MAAEVTDAARIKFDIETRSLHDALTQYGKRTGINVLFLEDLVAGKTAPPLKGLYSREEALRHLIEPSNLCYKFASDRSTVAVKQCQIPQPPAQEVVSPKSPPPRRNNGENAFEMVAMEEPLSVIVTGSHIKGPELPVGPKPVVVSAADLLELGVTSLDDLGHAESQLFGGGPSQDTHHVGAEALSNTGLGSAFNVRGLGAGETLMLVNGRRLAPSGSAGLFVDDLNIPLIAIKQVEILTDGVSAIYGADSVAGVVNIITKDSSDRGETAVDASVVTQGAWKAGRVAQSLSNDWESGGVFGSVEYSKNTALPARDRSFASSDLRGNGGPDLDQPFAWPPNIVVGKQTWAAPPGLTAGVPSTSQLQAGVPNLENVHSNSDLWPLQELTSAYGQAHQSFGDHLKITLEGILSHRRAEESDGGDRVSFTLPTTSPYYLNSIAQGNPMTVETDLFSALGPEVTHVDVRTIYGALNMEFPLGPDSSINLGASRALETEHQLNTNVGNPTALADSSVGFDPFVVPSALSAKTLAAIRGDSSFDQGSELHEYSLQWSGPITDLNSSTASGDNTRKIMGAAGVEYRSQLLRTSDSVMSGTYDRYDGWSKAVYGELTFPVLKPDKAGQGQLLELSLAGRYEDYSAFGHSAVPRFAVRWAPVPGLEFLGSVGQSVKTPNLAYLNTSRNTVSVGPPPSGIGEVIYLSGNYAHLHEESATNATFEVNFTRQLSEQSTLGLDAQLFSVNDYGRIQKPDISEIGADLLTSPDYASLVTRNPSAALVNQLCSSPQLYRMSLSQCLGGSYLAIVDLQLRNIDRLVTQGVDFRNSWTVSPSWGKVELKWNGTYIFRYADRSTPSAPIESLLNTQNNPIDLQTHASVGVTSHGFGADVTTNFSSGYRDTASQPIRSIASWTTVDLQVRYAFDPIDDTKYGWLVQLGVKNVANRNPPFLINSVESLGYDQENADPLGRLVTLSLRKQW